MAPFAMITMELDQTPKDLLKKGVINLIENTPQDKIIYLCTGGEPAAMKDISAQMPNLRALYSYSLPLPATFPEPNLGMK